MMTSTMRKPAPRATATKAATAAVATTATRTIAKVRDTLAEATKALARLNAAQRAKIDEQTARIAKLESENKTLRANLHKLATAAKAVGEAMLPPPVKDDERPNGGPVSVEDRLREAAKLMRRPVPQAQPGVTPTKPIPGYTPTHPKPTGGFSQRDYMADLMGGGKARR